jgi:hypothetical protein
MTFRKVPNTIFFFQEHVYNKNFVHQTYRAKWHQRQEGPL